MIPKPESKPTSRRKAKRQPKPVEVELTVRFNFGKTPEEAITVVDQQRIPMVNSVFESRDRILRGFAGLLIKTGLKQPGVARELFPVMKMLRKKKK